MKFCFLPLCVGGSMLSAFPLNSDPFSRVPPAGVDSQRKKNREAFQPRESIVNTSRSKTLTRRVIF
jgi:hypothetical protein